LVSGEHAGPVADDLRWLGELTNAVRELDVALAHLPPDDALDPLRRLLRDDRDTAQAALAQGLASDRYASFRRGALALTRPSGAPSAPRSARAWADDAIGAAHAAVRRRTKQLDHPEQRHDLRKAAKRLRYVLEAFAPLYDRQALAPARSELRSLQDVLGTVQDSDVHIALLTGAARRLVDAPPETLLAMGALVEGERRRGAKAARRAQGRATRFRKRWRAP
jgi:CHAD domain-containing protein